MPRSIYDSIQVIISPSHTTMKNLSQILWESYQKKIIKKF